MFAEDIERGLIAAMAAVNIPVQDGRGILFEHRSKHYKTIPMAKRRGFCFHHAGAVGTIKGAARYHVETKDWPGLAYGLAIDTDGSLTIAHDLDVKTYSQGDADTPGDENAAFIGVLVNGFFRSRGFPEADEPTIAQLKTVIKLISFGQQNGLAEITGHYMFGKPACPGATIQAIIEAARFHGPFDFPLDTVQGRQAALAALGFDVGPIDGVWGFRSRSALSEFQRAAKITIDGTWGPQTKKAMLAHLTKGSKL